MWGLLRRDNTVVKRMGSCRLDYFNSMTKKLSSITYHASVFTSVKQDNAPLRVSEPSDLHRNHLVQFQAQTFTEQELLLSLLNSIPEESILCYLVSLSSLWLPVSITICQMAREISFTHSAYESIFFAQCTYTKSLHPFPLLCLNVSCCDCCGEAILEVILLAWKW